MKMTETLKNLGAILLIILVNKKRIVTVLLIIAVIISAVFLYKPYLRRFEYPLKYSKYVTASAERFDIDPLLIYSVMKAESKFEPNAKSDKEAQGLMQITPDTARWALEQIGLDENSDIFRPEVNITVGSWYLAKLIFDHNGDLTAALAAYNAGSTNVNEWKNGENKLTLDDIQFEETHDYVYKTLEYYENYKKLYTEGE